MLEWRIIERYILLGNLLFSIITLRLSIKTYNIDKKDNIILFYLSSYLYYFLILL